MTNMEENKVKLEDLKVVAIGDMSCLMIPRNEEFVVSSEEMPLGSICYMYSGTYGNGSLLYLDPHPLQVWVGRLFFEPWEGELKDAPIVELDHY